MSITVDIQVDVTAETLGEYNDLKAHLDEKLQAELTYTEDQPALKITITGQMVTEVPQ